MSKFKLDFDISSHRRAAPRKARRTRTTTRTTTLTTTRGPEERSAEDAEQKVAEDTHGGTHGGTHSGTHGGTHGDREEPATPASASFEFTVPLLKSPRLSLRFLLGFIVIFGGAACLFPALRAHDFAKKHALTISRCNTHNNAVTCQSACGVRGNCNTPRVVAFASKKCADEVHTVHLHDAGGATRRIPAFYLRVPNTSMFEFSGDRGIFRPASCQAEMHDVFLRAIPETQTLQGYLWWVTGKSAHSFDVVRGTKIVAELDASVVLHRCYSEAHCVFKLPMACSVAKEAHVFGQSAPQSASQSASGQKKAETFVFC